MYRNRDRATPRRSPFHRGHDIAAWILIAALAAAAISALDPEWRGAIIRSVADGRLADELKRPELWGVEYGFIGAHVAAGRGFAGPYPDVTAPTAVMPPLLPLIFGAVFTLAGYQTAGAFVILQLLRVVAIGLGLACIDRLADELGARSGLDRVVLRATIALFVLVYAPRRLFFQLYDEWFLFGTVAACLLLAVRNFGPHGRDDRRSIVVWGLALGAMALTQPVIAFALGLATVAAALRSRRPRWLLALALSALVVAPWSVRNAVRFGTPLPIKSTLFFELYYGTLVSPRGIHLEEEVMNGEHHPFFDGAERRHAIELGERAYFAEKRRLFLSSLAERPGLYFSKVAYRAAYATILFPFSRAHQTYFNPVVPLVLKYVLYPLPFMALILCWPGRTGRRADVRFLTVCYVAYLAPYVLIHFWLRYWVQLLPLHVLLVFLGYRAIGSLYRRGRSDA